MQLHPDQRQALESPVTVVKRVEQAAQYPVRIIFTVGAISSSRWQIHLSEDPNNLEKKTDNQGEKKAKK